MKHIEGSMLLKACSRTRMNRAIAAYWPRAKWRRQESAACALEPLARNEKPGMEKEGQKGVSQCSAAAR